MISRLLQSVLLGGMLLVAAGSAVRAADAPQAEKKEPAKLVIVKAQYGTITDAATTVDVTAQVVALVKDNALTVDATNANFTDPAVKKAKMLKVDYKIGEFAFSKSVPEGKTLTLTNALPKLIIVKAVYGDQENAKTVDVTVAVAALIKDDALTVVVSNMLGGDPAPGAGKQLKVDYVLNGKAESKSAGERDTLIIGTPKTDPNVAPKP